MINATLQSGLVVTQCGFNFKAAKIVCETYKIVKIYNPHDPDFPDYCKNVKVALKDQAGKISNINIEALFRGSFKLATINEVKKYEQYNECKH